MASGVGCRVCGVGCRVKGIGCRVSGVGCGKYRSSSRVSRMMKIMSNRDLPGKGGSATRIGRAQEQWLQRHSEAGSSHAWSSRGGRGAGRKVRGVVNRVTRGLGLGVCV